MDDMDTFPRLGLRLAAFLIVGLTTGLLTGLGNLYLRTGYFWPDHIPTEGQSLTFEMNIAIAMDKAAEMGLVFGLLFGLLAATVFLNWMMDKITGDIIIGMLEIIGSLVSSAAVLGLAVLAVAAIVTAIIFVVWVVVAVAVITALGVSMFGD